MKYLYTDRYVGNRRSNRVDEFVGNGETEREREVEILLEKEGKKEKERSGGCVYTQGGKGGSRTPSKGSPTFLIKSTLAEPPKRVAPALRAVENSCLRGAVRQNNCIDACNITGGY